MQYRSRLHSKLQKTLYKNTLLSMTLMVIIVAIVFFFGLKVLVQISLFLGDVKSREEIPASSQNAFLLPPTLDPIVEATNSSILEISGTASQPGTTVEIYLNGEAKTNVLVDNNLKFAISALRLATGENKIKAKTIQDGKESTFTDETTIVYETTPPALEIQEPPDGLIVNKTPQVKISGKTESDSSIAINDFLPIVDGNGNFSYIFLLNEGENVIKIVAKDKAGNQTTNEVKVTFQH